MKFFVMAFALSVFSTLAFAQYDYGFYLQKARQRLAEGDCVRAEILYHTFVDLTNRTDNDIEQQIQECRMADSSNVEDYDSYLRRAQQRLNEGDCAHAETNYNLYKRLTGKIDIMVEKEIRDCLTINSAAKSIEPFTVFYNIKKNSVFLDRRDNAVARAMLVDKIASGAIIKGFRIDVWIGPDISSEHTNDMAYAYGNAIEKDINTLLKKCGRDPKEYLFETNAHGVDWETFLFFVENSTIKDKYAIMNQLNNSNDKEVTLEELLALYPEFEKEIMPLLRRVQVYVY